MDGQLPEKQAKNLDWATLGYHFQQSTYIAVAWEWFLVLTARLADPFLLLSILYAGFKVTNADLASHIPEAIDAFVNVGQNIALDAAGIGLLAMAAQAEKEDNEKSANTARVIGYTLLAMMVVNMGLSSLSKAFHWQEESYSWLIALLLVVRAILSVAYGTISRSLRKSGNQAERSELANMVSVSEKTQQIESKLQQVETTCQQQVQLLSEGMQRLADMQQQHNEMIAAAKTLDHILIQESEERKQSRSNKKPARVKEPIGLPQKKKSSKSSNNFDKKQFVFDCLKANPETKISEIQERALKEGQALSVGTASAYRKEYFKNNPVDMMSETESDPVETYKTESEEMEKVVPANIAM